MIRYVTSGESHGKQLTVILEGIPAGLKLRPEDINAELARRQQGFGRGARMLIEKDQAEIVSGVRWGETIGSPVTLVIKNRDWENNKKLLSEDAKEYDKKLLQLRARPGHADLAGVLKFNRRDIRDILERASARETAARVAAGAVCKKFIAAFNVLVYSFVREIGAVEASLDKAFSKQAPGIIESSPVRTPDPSVDKTIMDLITKAREKGDTLGGVFTVVAKNIVPGLGSCAQWDEKLDALLAAGMLSIQSVKGVEFGAGFGFAALPGSTAHDEIYYSRSRGFYRLSNNAGGFEGGMTNGEDIVISCAVKPIPSLNKPLKSVNIASKQSGLAEPVRSDVCVVPAVGIIGEAVAAFELARAMKVKFGGDSMGEIERNVKGYRKQVREY